MATIIRRIAQDGTVSYLARVRRKGAPPQAATFANRSEAQRWVHITEGAVLEGRHFPTVASRRHTLTDALDRYEQNVLRWKAPGTIAKQTQILRWWRTHLGYITLTDITTAVMIEKQMALARTLAPATCNLYCNTLSHVLSTVVRWE